MRSISFLLSSSLFVFTVGCPGITAKDLQELLDTGEWEPWRTLLERTFGADGFACPNCFRRMRLRAVVMPPATLRVLDGLNAASRAPPDERVAS